MEALLAPVSQPNFLGEIVVLVRIEDGNEGTGLCTLPTIAPPFHAFGSEPCQRQIQPQTHIKGFR